MTSNEEISAIVEKFPFLTVLDYMEKTYIGVIQNCDEQIFSMYVYNNLPSEDIKKVFLHFGDLWWWESNRQVPINMFVSCMGYDFTIFKPYLKTFIAKEVSIVAGPTVSLSNINQRRVKRRSISLVKKVK